MNSERADRLFLFLVGLFAYLHVRVVGFIPIAELMFAATAFFIIVRNYPLYTGRTIRVVIFLWIGWVISAIASDLLRGTVPAQYLRGWARVICFGLGILCLYPALHRNPSNIKWLVLGALPSSLLGMFVFQSGAHEVVEAAFGVDRTWQRYYVLPFTNLLVLIAAWTYRRSPGVVVLLLLISGVGNIALGSRSGGAVLVGASAVTAFFTYQQSKAPRKRRPLRFAQIVAFACIAALGGVATYFGYTQAASSGMLGEQALKKYETQSESRFGLILGGRLAFVAGTLAIWESPLLGYGSWPEDRYGFYYRAQELAATKIYEARSDDIGFPRIPSHSYLLEAWVEHGILGGLFWLFFIIFLVRFTVRWMLVRPDLIGLLSVQLVFFGWNILFSPLGNRPTIAAFLAVFVAIADRAIVNEERRSSSQRRARIRARMSKDALRAMPARRGFLPGPSRPAAP